MGPWIADIKQPSRILKKENKNACISIFNIQTPKKQQKHITGAGGTDEEPMEMTLWLLKIVLIPELHKCSQGYVTQTPIPKKANKNTARKLKQAAVMAQSAIPELEELSQDGHKTLSQKTDS